MRIKLFKKFLSIATTASLLVNSLYTPYYALAQESTLEPTPTEESTVAPEPTVISDSTAEPTPSEEATSTPEVTEAPTADPITPEPEQTQPETQETTNENSQSQAPPEESSSPTSISDPIPTVTPVQPEEEGTLTAEIVETNLFSETLQENSWFSVITDKLDYAPTEAAVISGSGFTPGETYTLIVSSTDDPATSTIAEVTADLSGEFTYTYQLDGIYRPNYLVEVKGEGEILASTTFTDSDTGFKFPTSTHSDSGWDVNTVANVQSSNDVYATDNDEDEQDWSNFSFSTIPAGSTIDGIEIKIEAKTSLASGCQLETRLSWDNGNNETSIKTAALTNSDVINTLGGASDTWGRTWAPGEFTNANFVLKVRADDVSGSTCTGGSLASFDHIQARVYYTESAPIGPISAQSIACMGDQPTAPNPINCTANDIQLGSVDDINIVEKSDDGITFVPASGQACDYPGQYIKFTASWHVQSTATERYNVGLWFANEGQESALYGNCSASTLPNVPSPFFEATDDMCGDIESGGTGTVSPDITVVARCIAAPGTDQLNLPYCTSWDNNETAGNACNGPEDTVAGTPSKCNCDNSNPIQITVPQVAEIEVVKELDPASDAGTFNLAVNGTNEASCVGDGGSTNKVTVGAGISSDPGDTHTVGENVIGCGTTDLSDYNSSISCVDRGLTTFDGGAALTQSGVGPLNVAVDPDDDIVCTITNTLNSGHIIVNKVAVGGDDTFDFTASGTGYNNFSLINGGSNNQEVLPGSYSISEDILGGWDSDGGVCNQGETPASLDVESGETVTCTFTNTKRGHLIVEKTTVPASDPQIFGITATGSGTISDGGAGTITDVLDKDYEVTPGTYSVTESEPGNWVETSNNCTDVVVAAGDTVYCQIVNTKKGNVTVTKYHDHNANGVKDQGDETLNGWWIHLGAASQATAGSGQVTFSDLNPDAYVLSETVEQGWFQSNISCGSEAGIDSDNVHSVTVTPGQTTNCSIGNYQKGSVLGTKFEDLDGTLDTLDDQDGIFNWVVELYTCASDFTGCVLSLTDNTNSDGEYGFVNLLPGYYQVKEVLTAGWDNLTALFHNITITSGDSITDKDFVNTEYGSIRVLKKVDTDGDGDIDVENSNGWTWELGTLDYQTGAVAVEVLPGTYNISEFQSVVGYHVTDLTCSDTGSLGAVESAQVTVSSNEDVVCTFTNTRNIGNLQITKLIDADGDFSTENDRTPAENWLVDVDPDGQDTSDPTLSATDINGQSSALGIKTGTYWVSEDSNGPDDNHHFIGSFCTLNEQSTGNSGTNSFGGVEVATNSTTYCTFVNARDTASVKVNKFLDIDGDGEFETLNPESYTWSLDGVGTNAMGSTVSEIVTGAHDVNEEGPDGHHFVGWFLGHPSDNQYSCNNLPEYSSTDLPLGITVETDATRQVNLCNAIDPDPNITISKTNNAANTSAGSTVTYTLEVNNDGNVAIFNIDITDTLPGGFTYVLGSTTGATTSDPVIEGSKLTWNDVQNLTAGESLTLSYQVLIASDLSSGTYINFATCSGDVRGQEGQQNCNEDDSSVTIGGGQSYGGSLQGQVLGASTELPATGSPTVLLLVTLGLLGVGLILKGASGKRSVRSTVKRSSKRKSSKKRKHAKK